VKDADSKRKGKTEEGIECREFAQARRRVQRTRPLAESRSVPESPIRHNEELAKRSSCRRWGSVLNCKMAAPQSFSRSRLLPSPRRTSRRAESVTTPRHSLRRANGNADNFGARLRAMRSTSRAFGMADGKRVDVKAGAEKKSAFSMQSARQAMRAFTSGVWPGQRPRSRCLSIFDLENAHRRDLRH